MTPQTEDQGRTGVVTSVIRGQSPYAFARVAGIAGDVTFSLAPDLEVWCEDSWPRQDVKVILFDIRNIRGKWRAHKARYYRLDDEEPKE